MFRHSILFFVIAIIAAVAGLDALTKPRHQNHPAPVRLVPASDHEAAHAARGS
jgi:hypothetical protein